jgi:hypothetical protein
MNSRSKLHSDGPTPSGLRAHVFEDRVNAGARREDGVGLDLVPACLAPND